MPKLVEAPNWLSIKPSAGRLGPGGACTVDFNVSIDSTVLRDLNTNDAGVALVRKLDAILTHLERAKTSSLQLVLQKVSEGYLIH